MGTQRRVKRAKRGTQSGSTQSKLKSKSGPPGGGKGAWEGLGAAKQPQRTRRLAGGLRASLSRSQSKGSAR